MKKLFKENKESYGDSLRAMCNRKVVDRKMTEKHMDRLSLKEAIDQLATANGVRRYGRYLNSYLQSLGLGLG